MRLCVCVCVWLSSTISMSFGWKSCWSKCISLKMVTYLWNDDLVYIDCYAALCSVLCAYNIHWRFLQPYLEWKPADHACLWVTLQNQSYDNHCCCRYASHNDILVPFMPIREDLAPYLGMLIFQGNLTLSECFVWEWSLLDIAIVYNIFFLVEYTFVFGVVSVCGTMYLWINRK